MRYSRTEQWNMVCDGEIMSAGKASVSRKCKRGCCKKEAQNGADVQLQNSSDMDMSFEAFTELYIRDMKSRLKENTWLTRNISSAQDFYLISVN